MKHTLTELGRLLGKAGFVQSQFMINDAYHFQKPFTDSMFGDRPFSVFVRVSGHGEEQKFVSCELVGPKADLHRKTVTRSTGLGEWRSIKGAIEGVIPKYKAAYKELTGKIAELKR